MPIALLRAKHEMCSSREKARTLDSVRWILAAFNRSEVVDDATALWQTCSASRLRSAGVAAAWSAHSQRQSILDLSSSDFEEAILEPQE